MKTPQEAPIIHATPSNFTNLPDYLEKQESNFKQISIGLIKIIPPNLKTVRSIKQTPEKILQNIELEEVKEQNPQFKSKGVYEIMSFTKKSLNYKKLKKKFLMTENTTDELNPKQIQEKFFNNLTFSPPFTCSKHNTTLFGNNDPLHSKKFTSILDMGMQSQSHQNSLAEPEINVGVWKTMIPWQQQPYCLGQI